MIQIGDIKLRNSVFLAPMSGVSDLPFRKAAFDLGAGLVITEMVASEQLAKSCPDVLLRASDDGSISPFVVQLAGREPRWMAEGARISEAAGADIIDINMGCPARHVTGALSGSALMRNVDHALDLIKATVDAVQVPVTLKMRLGWDHSSLNAPEIAAKAEAIGIKMFTVHGRTRQQFYKNIADWSAVKETVNEVSVPVIVNGDITSVEDAKMALSESGAQGVMIGRACEGQPWLPGQIATQLSGQAHSPLSLAQMAEIAIAHYTATIDHYSYGDGRGPELGRARGIRMARKHLAAYIAKLDRPMSGTIRRSLCRTVCTLNEPTEIVGLLKTVFCGEIEELTELAA